MALTRTIPFSSGTGFTFDSALIDFSSGAAKLKDLRPTGALFHANYASSINANWASGSLTGTGTGSPTVAGGLLVLTGGTTKYVSYPVASNAQITQTGCIRYDYVPNYSGTPAADRGHFAIYTDVAGVNLIDLVHNTAGNLVLRIFGSSGSSIMSANLGNFNPTSGTSYEFEVNFDLTAGATRLFINGTQKGSTQVQTGTRTNTAASFLVGSNLAAATASDFSIGSFTIFNAVQHTANYTSGAAITPTIYSVADPSVELDAEIGIHDLISFSPTVTVSGSDLVKYTQLVDGVEKYHNGTVWATSNGTYAQANTAAEITAAGTSLTAIGVDHSIKAYLHSADGSTTPSLASVSYDYEPFENPTAEPNKCYCFLRISDLLGSQVEGAELIAYREEAFFHGDFLVLPYEVSVESDVEGFAEILLYETDTVSESVNFKVKYIDPNTGVEKEVVFDPIRIPDQETLDLSEELVIAS